MKRSFTIAGCRRRQVLGGALLVGSAVALARGAASASGDGDIRQPVAAKPAAYLARAFAMRAQASAAGDQPYGAVVVSPDGRIVGQAPSRVITAGDPTAHAEVEAIRDAARRLGRRDLSGHVLYASSRPCPMCEAAAYWAGLAAMVHGREGHDAGAPRLCRRV